MGQPDALRHGIEGPGQVSDLVVLPVSAADREVTFCQGPSGAGEGLDRDHDPVLRPLGLIPKLLGLCVREVHQTLDLGHQQVDVGGPLAHRDARRGAERTRLHQVDDFLPDRLPVFERVSQGHDVLDVPEEPVVDQLEVLVDMGLELIYLGDGGGDLVLAAGQGQVHALR